MAVVLVVAAGRSTARPTPRPVVLDRPVRGDALCSCPGDPSMTATPSPRADTPPGLWAITSYFNPLHYHTRLANYRTFQRHLGVPLLTVEQGYDGRFDLDGRD